MWRKSSSGGRSNRALSPKTSCFAEMLEPRFLLSTVTVNAQTTLRTVPSDLIGINTAPWDGLLNSAQTLSLSQAAGVNAVRIGGGSTADLVHFNSLTYYNNASQTSSATSMSNSATFGQAALYAGSLNDPSGFHPTIAIFTRDRPAWAAIPPGLTLFEQLPGGG